MDRPCYAGAASARVSDADAIADRRRLGVSHAGEHRQGDLAQVTLDTLGVACRRRTTWGQAGVRRHRYRAEQYLRERGLARSC
ncbi:hypothetical protein GCM10027517_13190 [Phycicoccus ginsengisoli]